MDRVISWWESLESREQIIVAIGGIFLTIALFFFLVISPVMSWHNSVERKLTQSIETAAEVKKLAAQVKARKQSNTGNKPNQGLSVLIDSSLRENKLVMRGFQPGANNDARLRLENAAYSSLAQWLYDLEYRHGISILDLSLTPASTSGRLMVSVRVSQ
jgi:general secretion pathway protein M